MKRSNDSWRKLFSKSYRSRRQRVIRGRQESAEALETRLVLTPTFDAGTVYPLASLNGGGHPETLAAGDFNHDGRLDLVTSNTSDASVSILLADGPCCFDTAHNYPTGSGPISVVVGDFNEDSNLDVVTADTYANTLSVLLGNGSGGFAAPIPFAVGAGPRTVIVEDFNHDGHRDLAVTNSDSTTVSVLLGNGAGGFASTGPFGVGGFPLGLTTGDFNGDTKLDLAATIGNRVSILLGDGLGSFGPFMAFGVIGNDFAQAHGITTADFNGDHKLDLAVTNSIALFAVSVALGNGDGTFGAVSHYNAGTVQYGIVAADFDQDGAIDLAVGTPNTLHVRVLPGTGTGGFTAPVNLPTEGAYGVVAADFNLDGFPDLAATNVVSNNVRVFLNLSPYSGTTTDYGDASDTGLGTGIGNYQTTTADGGASHLALGPMLGLYRDPDADGQPSANANGDDAAPGTTPDDEDGIALPAQITASTTAATTASLTVNLQCPSATTNKLDGWIDFNRDGDWTDPGEQIFMSYELGTTSGIQTLNFTIPQALELIVDPGVSYARFRLSTSGGLAPTGAAADGEVEDYLVNIIVTSPPSRVISGATSTNEGATYTLGLSASGQGVGSIDHWTINWGDGNTETVNGNPSSVPHVYADGPNNFTILASATDSSGTYNANALAITVNNVAPSVARDNASVTVNAGVTASNTGTWSDPGVDIVTLTASIGTVTKNANGTWSWSLATNGATASQTVTITATDSDNAVSSTTFTLTVNSINNLAPVITAISNSSPDCGGAFQGERVVVSALFTDANTADTHTASINWGDGTTTVGTVTESNGSGSVAGNHVYATGGFYTITVTVTDGGLSDTETTSDVISGVGLHGGVLYIIGTDGKDVVHVNATCGDRLNVHANFDVGRRHRGNCNEDLEDDDWSDNDDDRDSRKGAERYRFKASDVTRIEMRLCDGDDVGHVTRRVHINALIDGEDGDDKLRGGAGNDTVLGGCGDDKLWAATGNDLLDGGDGNDKLFGGQGSDTLLGGKGCDQIKADGGADSINGGDGNDDIFAGRGNDTIDGGAGDDDIHEGCGGGGSDVINGGSGNDTIRAGRDGDVIDGGIGNDVIYGGQGADLINGGEGNDVIRAGNGNDTVFAGAGNDCVDGDGGDDLLDLGTGNDSADGGNGDDIVLGGDGNDTIAGSQGRDLLIGGIGADKLTGNADEDVLIAGNTSYDATQAALLAIMAEWSSNKTYAVRVSNLLNGNGLTAGNKLNGNDGASQTVFADADIDTLTGSQGTDLFWANIVADNGGAIDVLMDKANNESANDIDL